MNYINGSQRTFEVKKIHMGKPAWSWTTTVIRGILKIGTLLRLYPFEGDIYEESLQPHGYPWFIRAVCTARDRYLTYIQARRFSSNGSLVLCDRYSFPRIYENGRAAMRICDNQFQKKRIGFYSFWLTRKNLITSK